jgi:hypothetical protein
MIGRFEGIVVSVGGRNVGTFSAGPVKTFVEPHEGEVEFRTVLDKIKKEGIMIIEPAEFEGPVLTDFVRIVPFEEAPVAYIDQELKRRGYFLIPLP